MHEVGAAGVRSSYVYRCSGADAFNKNIINGERVAIIAGVAVKRARAVIGGGEVVVVAGGWGGAAGDEAGIVVSQASHGKTESLGKFRPPSITIPIIIIEHSGPSVVGIALS